VSIAKLDAERLRRIDPPVHARYDDVVLLRRCRQVVVDKGGRISSGCCSQLLLNRRLVHRGQRMARYGLETAFEEAAEVRSGMAYIVPDPFLSPRAAIEGCASVAIDTSHGSA